MTVKTVSLLTALLILNGAVAYAQPESAHDSHLTLNEAVPDTFRFAGPEEVVAFFEQQKFTVDTWQAGGRSIPRLYLASVPPRWRDEVAPHLTVLQKKRYFFFVYAPLVLESNEDILLDRSRLLALEATSERTADGEAWLLGLARSYFVIDDEDTSVDAGALAELRSRVDAIPPSLALAQAAVESGWSTSRFAVEGNALFGQWTWGEDGITPQEQRGQLGNYKIRRFDSPEGSIAAYMHNLNTHRSYRDFREERARMRAAGVQLSGSDLARTLTAYSEKGEEYTDMLQTVIRVNNLAPTDVSQLRDMQPVLLVPVGEGAE